MVENTNKSAFIRRQKSRTLIQIAVIGISTMLAVTAICTFTFGRVELVQLRFPDFARRYQVYYEIPLINVRVWQSRDEIRGSPLGNHLRAEGIIRGADLESAQWMVVGGRLGRATPVSSIATPFYRMLLEKEGDLLAWSQTHADRARVLWPHIYQWHNRGRYFIATIIIADMTGGAYHSEEAFNRALSERQAVFEAGRE